jgi:hypothetical protein
MTKNAVVREKETDKAMNFICETKEGKYTIEKPDLSYIAYSRMEIQEEDVINTFSDYPDEVILYGISD